MAEIRIEGDELVLALSPLEKLGALHGDVRVPRACVRQVEGVERPLAHVRGLRVPGTAVPFVLALGTWRGRFGKDFVAANRGPGLVITLENSPFARLVVSTPDAARIRAQLSGSSHALT